MQHRASWRLRQDSLNLGRNIVVRTVRLKDVPCSYAIHMITAGHLRIMYIQQMIETYFETT